MCIYIYGTSHYLFRPCSCTASRRAFMCYVIYI